MKTTIDVPRNVSDYYSHNLFKTPETCAGARASVMKIPSDILLI